METQVETLTGDPPLELVILARGFTNAALVSHFVALTPLAN
jgi:hypothetical protein